VPTVSLHVHERIDPHTIIEAVERRNGAVEVEQPALFETPEENPPLSQAIDFYQHDHSWSNRLIAGVIYADLRTFPITRAVDDFCTVLHTTKKRPFTGKTRGNSYEMCRISQLISIKSIEAR